MIEIWNFGYTAFVNNMEMLCECWVWKLVIETYMPVERDLDSQMMSDLLTIILYKYRKH